MTPRPPVHPLTEKLAEFLIGAFASEAPAILAGVRLIAANPVCMRFIEAYCYIHEPLSDADPNVMQQREGMRIVALTLAASLSLSDDDLNAMMEAPNGRR